MELTVGWMPARLQRQDRELVAPLVVVAARPDLALARTQGATTIRRLRLLQQLAMIALMGALLAACGTTLSARGNSSTAATTIAAATGVAAPTALDVLRFGGPLVNRVAPFEAHTDDASKVQQLYADILALPPLPSFGGCPEDIGAGYELSFTANGSLVFQAEVVGGCPAVRLPKPNGCRVWNAAFVAQVAATLGVSPSSLTPSAGLRDSAGQNGPFAPSAPTPPVITADHCTLA